MRENTVDAKRRRRDLFRQIWVGECKRDSSTKLSASVATFTHGVKLFPLACLDFADCWTSDSAVTQVRSTMLSGLLD